ncbi:winged helix-turn-helix domain-containing protein [Streptomyces sp. NPDC002644]
MATTHASDLHVPAPHASVPHAPATHGSTAHTSTAHGSVPHLADPAGRRRLRAVGSGATAASTAAAVAEQVLPPGATWLPAPPQAVPTLPGQPPMVGYLVLVPADRQPPFLRDAAATGFAAPHDAAATGTPPGAAPADGDVIRVDVQRRTAEVDGRPLDLTYLEFELLAHLVAHPHRVHTRDQLVATVWGYGHVGDGRTVDVHIARLRRKLGAEYRQSIRTVRRVGYKYTPPQAG